MRKLSAPFWIKKDVSLQTEGKGKIESLDPSLPVQRDEEYKVVKPHHKHHHRGNSGVTTHSNKSSSGKSKRRKRKVGLDDFNFLLCWVKVILVKLCWLNQDIRQTCVQLRY